MVISFFSMVFKFDVTVTEIISKLLELKAHVGVNASKNSENDTSHYDNVPEVITNFWSVKLIIIYDANT